MRAREPDTDGYVDRDGFKLHWEVFGDGEPTLLLLPAWTVVHARFWKAQVPYLARHPDRVLGNVFICPSVDLELGGEMWSEPFDEPYASTDGWARYNRHYWLEHWEEFLEFFFSQCFTEPHSTKQIEDCVGWGLETTPKVVIARERAPWPDEATLRGWCARVRRPVMVIHGDEDEISPPRCGAALAHATGGALVVLEGAGHIPNTRDPVKVNQLIRDFAESVSGRA